MKKPELLCPAGNMETLKYAVNFGADAVYIGGKFFGARSYANNFSNDEIVEAINYCHLYGVKLYITVNTIIYEDEINKFLEYIKFIHKNGVDAILMQDIGMIKLIRDTFPNLEIHASTQAHNHNNEGIKFFKDLGLTRVVLDREMSLEEINNIDVDIEKEAFVYGALCVCYSGNCLFSSLNGGRSGNRGNCTGSCRLPYKLIKDNKEIKVSGKYLLSTKELNTLPKLESLLKSNIDSLKIEGRMKSPIYVGFVTKTFRTLIDNYFLYGECKYTDEMNYNLKKLFNRDFTEGYLFDENIMNINTSNHLGVKIGKVIDVGKKIKLKLNSFLSQNDGIRIGNQGMVINKLYNNNDLLVNKIENGFCFIDNKIDVKIGDDVLKTNDFLLNKSLENYNEKKIPIDIDVNLSLEKLYFSFSDNKNSVSYTSYDVEKSITRPIDKDKVIYQLSKLGNTPFIVNNFNLKMDDNLFISLKLLNEIRRELTEKLILKRISKKEIIVNDIKENSVQKNKNININVLVRNENQLKCVLNKVDNIYVTDFNLYKKYKNNNVFYRVNRVISKHIDYKNENLLIGEIGGLYYSKNNNVKTDYYLNCVNSYSCNFLNNYASSICISPEIDFDRLKDTLNHTSNCELIVYGRLELMILKGNLIENIGLSGEGYCLKNIKGNLYPIVNDDYTHVMHCENTNMVNDVKMLKNIGLNNFRIELFDEDNDKINEIINKIKAGLN